MRGEVLVLTTESAAQTREVGGRLAEMLKCLGNRSGGRVVALRGDLATGKTCLVQGMAERLLLDNPVHSPTFTVVNEYGTSPTLYHLDLYRLSGPEELADLGYEEIFDSEAICAVEWSERAEEVLPEERLDVLLEHAGAENRRIQFEDRGLLPEGWRDLLSRALS